MEVAFRENRVRRIHSASGPSLNGLHSECVHDVSPCGVHDGVHDEVHDGVQSEVRCVAYVHDDHAFHEAYARNENPLRGPYVHDVGSCHVAYSRGVRACHSEYADCEDPCVVPVLDEIPFHVAYHDACLSAAYDGQHAVDDDVSS